MLKSRIGSILLYGGINRVDFDSVRSMVWRRNLNSLRITASLAAGIGALFLIINRFLGSGN